MKPKEASEASESSGECWMKASFVGCTEASADGGEEGRREVGNTENISSSSLTIKPSHHHTITHIIIIIISVIEQ